MQRSAPETERSPFVDQVHDFTGDEPKLRAGGILNVEQADKLRRWLDDEVPRYLKTSAGRIEALRLCREHYNGDMFVALVDGKRVRAVTDPGVIAVTYPYSPVLVDAWASFLARAVKWGEAKGGRSGENSSGARMVNRGLRYVYLESQIEMFKSAWAREVAKVGEAYAYRYFSREQGEAIEVDPETSEIIRTGNFVFEVVGADEMVFEPGAKNFRDSAMCFRVQRMPLSQARRMFGQFVGEGVGAVISDPAWERVRYDVSGYVFKERYGEGDPNNKDCTIYDIWIRPATLREVCGEFPGIERGLRRRMFAPGGPGDGKVLSDEYWPADVVRAGRVPFYKAGWRIDPKTGLGHGVMEVCSALQDLLNISLTMIGNVNLRNNLGVLEVERGSVDLSKLALEVNAIWETTPGSKPIQPINFGDVSSGMREFINNVTGQMNFAVHVTPADLGRTVDEVSQPNTSLDSIEAERRRGLRAPIIEPFAVAMQELIEDVAIAMPVVWPGEMPLKLGGGDTLGIAQWDGAVAAGWDSGIQIVPGDLNARPDVINMEMLTSAADAGRLTADQFWRGVEGERADAYINPNSIRAREDASLIEEMLRNFDDQDPELQTALGPVPMIEQPSMQPVVDPATGQPVVDPATGQPQMEQGVEQVPDPSFVSYYDTAAMVVSDPYIEAAVRLRTDSDYYTFGPEKRAAIDRFVSEVLALDQVQAQVIEQTQMGLRKQGQSDKPFMAEQGAK